MAEDLVRADLGCGTGRLYCKHVCVVKAQRVLVPNLDGKSAVVHHSRSNVHSRKCLRYPEGKKYVTTNVHRTHNHGNPDWFIRAHKELFACTRIFDT